MIPLPMAEVLDSITIPVACPVPWDEMRGDHRTRFCDKCSQNVHDVSELTTAEAVELVTSGEKIPCLRLYRRQDGRVMTADCTTKRERVWKWLNKRSVWAAAVFALVFMGCTQLGEDHVGKICPPQEPVSADPSDSHNGEQDRRVRYTANHNQSKSSMNPDAKAEAPVRHETDR